MTKRILVDFHHSSLLRSLIMLFEDRLGYEVYRPIGMEWYYSDYWDVAPFEATALQYLGLEQGYLPEDGTPALNKALEGTYPLEDGAYYCLDPGGYRINRACTLDFFRDHFFSAVVSSVPQHWDRFEKLRLTYHPEALHIEQHGNEGWPMYANRMTLASIHPRQTDADAVFYHQEFPLDDFSAAPVAYNYEISSFVNLLHADTRAWSDFLELESMLADYTFHSYGGQCRDGFATGSIELGARMREADLIFHVKTGGDGYGHVLYNAYATGRPVICRRSDYSGRLGEELLSESGTCIDLDDLGTVGAAKLITGMEGTTALETMGRNALATFTRKVDWQAEAEQIDDWMTRRMS